MARVVKMTDEHDMDHYAQKSIELEERLKSDPVGAFAELQALAPESPACALLLGRAYDKGLGTAADPKTAETYLREAASKGADLGYYYLGKHYFDHRKYQEAREALLQGVAVGEVPSPEDLAAVEEVLAVVEQKLAVAKAYDLLNTDPQRAVVMLRRLAENGSAYSMLYLGWAHAQGLGVPPDSQQASEWYRQAYALGAREAGKYLGHYAYYDGCKYLEEEPKDYKKAFERFSEGAQYDYGPAVYWLARCYAKGLGVEQQPDEARRLYEKAAALGNLWAMRELAKLHMRGSYGLGGISKGVKMYVNCLKEIYRVASRDSSDIRLRK